MNRLVRSVLDGEQSTYSYDNVGNRLVKKSPEETTVYLRHGQIAVAMDIELPADVSETEGQGETAMCYRGICWPGGLAWRLLLTGLPRWQRAIYHLDHLKLYQGCNR